MKPIIIIIDCSVWPVPPGRTRTWAPIHSDILEIWVCLPAATTTNICSVTSQFHEKVAPAYIKFPASLMLHRACRLLFFFSDMGELSLSREGFTSYLGVPQELRVRAGDDVVLKCSASASEEPSYFWNKNVRKPGDCAQRRRPHYALGNSVRSLFLHPILDVTSLFFPSLVPVSLGPFPSRLASLKHSLNFLVSSSTPLFSLPDFLKPLVPPSTPPPPPPPLLSSPPPPLKCSVFKWPVGLGPPLAGDCSLPTYRGLIV